MTGYHVTTPPKEQTPTRNGNRNGGTTVFSSIHLRALGTKQVHSMYRVTVGSDT
jgi:hypothetical protein